MGNGGNGDGPNRIADRNGDDGNGSNLVADSLKGAAVIDNQGNRLGSVIDLYQEPKHSIAMLAKIDLPDHGGFAMIPTATAEVTRDGIRVDVSRDAIEGSPTLKSGRSILVKPIRVRAIYEYYDIRLPETLRKRTTGAIKTGTRRRRRAIFPGEDLEAVVSGSMQAKMTQWPLPK